VSGETNEDEVSALVRNVPSVRVIRSVPDVAELYGLADCFVSASRAEGLPYAIGEAMAAGLPVITSDLPQIAAVYGPAGPGVLTFRGGDPRALATAMGRILALPRGQREALGKRNAAFVQEHLSLQNWTERMIGVYRSVLETNGGRGSSSRA
jgi:glycosyltransferase involved in cell wall biosynthesis